MSSSFDTLQRIFMDRFQPISGDDFEKQLFLQVLTSMHSANHELGDQVNRNRNVSIAALTLDEYIAEKEEKRREPTRDGGE